jgi:DNA-directed RNA polymerase specialized sigma24 family protein
MAQVVKLRYFTGLTVEETARALDISARTVKRHWSRAKLWLYRELGGAAR